jgi:hypothetical protein
MNEWIQKHEKSHINHEKRNDANNEDNNETYGRSVSALILALTSRTKLFGLVLNVTTQLRQNHVIAIALVWTHISDI